MTETEGLHEIITQLCQKYGPICRLWMGSTLFILLTNPKDVEVFMTNHLKKGELYEFIEPLLGHGLLTAPVDTWKAHRKIMNPLFNQKQVNTYFGIFMKNSKRLIESLGKSSSSIDIFPMLYKSSCHNISEIVLGEEFATMLNKDYFSWVKKAENLIHVRGYNPLYHFNIFWNLSSAKKELDIMTWKIWNSVREVIHFSRESFCNKDISERNTTNLNILELMLQNNKWNVQELSEEIQTLLIAGGETTSVCQSFVLVVLGIYPNIQQKLYKEITSVLSESSSSLDLDVLSKMKYLDCVIWEVLRLFPSRPGLFRRAEEDVLLGCQRIPKGSTVAIPIVSIHRDPNLWPNPLEFDPDRFLPERFANTQRYAFMPFSVPPRNCIGIRLSIMAMKITLAMIVNQFKVTSTSYTSLEDIKLKIENLLMAENGFNVNLKLRKKKQVI